MTERVLQTLAEVGGSPKMDEYTFVGMCDAPGDLVIKNDEILGSSTFFCPVIEKTVTIKDGTCSEMECEHHM